MNNNFEIESISETNILHTRCSRLVNYGAKMLKVAGPLLWTSLPKHIRNSKSIFNLKSNIKKFFTDQYDMPEFSPSGSYFVSKLSLNCMKITCTKMHEFHIPPYLPDRVKVCNISNDGMKIKIFRK